MEHKPMADIHYSLEKAGSYGCARQTRSSGDASITSSRSVLPGKASISRVHADIFLPIDKTFVPKYDIV